MATVATVQWQLQWTWLTQPCNNPLYCTRWTASNSAEGAGLLQTDTHLSSLEPRADLAPSWPKGHEAWLAHGIAGLGRPLGAPPSCTLVPRLARFLRVRSTLPGNWCGARQNMPTLSQYPVLPRHAHLLSIIKLQPPDFPKIARQSFIVVIIVAAGCWSSVAYGDFTQC